jgi:mannose-6-phosphate isomerase
LFKYLAKASVVVPAGLPHAIGAGIFILELQEPTDLSILLEWNDFAVDGDSDGHLGLGFDLALDALRYTPMSDRELAQLISDSQGFGKNNFDIFTAAARPYFRADYLSGFDSDVPAGFAVLLILGGSGEIDFEQVPPFSVARGDAIVIPHAAGSWNLSGAQGIVGRPPLPKNTHLAS